jgi:phosphoribosylformimino-5-aminoimidazole carboxamide ribotide isomerase
MAIDTSLPHLTAPFQTWPAIDLIDAKPVRLIQGEYSKKTDYGDIFSLPEIVRIFSSFAHGIHVVDLDGAKKGSLVNKEAISTIINCSHIPVEVGGGIRTLHDARSLFSLGVSRIILGTSALHDPAFLQTCISHFGTEKIVVGIDAKDGFVATNGWEQSSEVSAESFLKKLQKDFGVQTIIFTDIATDGTLSGPPLETFQNLVNTFPNIDIIASGGISSINDIIRLKETGVRGAIFGKAFYEKKITVEEMAKLELNR